MKLAATAYSLIILFFFAYATPQADTNNHTTIVLLIHMFTETYSQCEDCQISVVAERVKQAFIENGIEVKLLIVGGGDSPKLENRLDTILRQMRLLFQKYKNLRITHIIFAGHGASQNNDIVVGDIAFSQRTVHGLKEYFKALRLHLAKNVKIFLYGCSTFRGWDKEILRRAQLLRNIFEAGKVEIFGYEYDIYATASRSFWTPNLNDLLMAYSSALFLGFFKYGFDHGVFLTVNHWLNFIKMLCGVPVITLGHYAYNAYLVDTKLITLIRQLIFYNNMGVVVAYENQTQTRFDRLLGHDYFRREFAQVDTV